MKDIVKFGRWESVHEGYTEIGVKDEESLESRGSQGYQKIIMSHYPILSWNKAHHGSWHLHGHCHGSLIKSQQEYYKRKVMDVGCNCIDYTPISYEQVKGIMVKKGVSAVDHHGED
jgi:calcineurin-like phosphoesterase family protein